MAGANPAALADFSGIHEYATSLFANWKRSTIGNVDEAFCFVPFHHLIPALRDMPALFLGLGQRLVLNLRMVPSGEALMHSTAVDGGAAPTYTISQAHGVFVYSILDAPRREMILRSNVSPIPVVKNISFQQIAQ